MSSLGGFLNDGLLKQTSRGPQELQPNPCSPISANISLAPSCVLQRNPTLVDFFAALDLQFNNTKLFQSKFSWFHCPSSPIHGQQLHCHVCFGSLAWSWTWKWSAVSIWSHLLGMPKRQSGGSFHFLWFKSSLFSFSFFFNYFFLWKQYNALLP